MDSKVGDVSLVILKVCTISGMERKGDNSIYAGVCGTASSNTIAEVSDLFIILN